MCTESESPSSLPYPFNYTMFSSQYCSTGTCLADLKTHGDYQNVTEIFLKQNEMQLKNFTKCVMLKGSCNINWNTSGWSAQCPTQGGLCLSKIEYNTGLPYLRRLMNYFGSDSDSSSSSSSSSSSGQMSSSSQMTGSSSQMSSSTGSSSQMSSSSSSSSQMSSSSSSSSQMSSSSSGNIIEWDFPFCLPNSCWTGIGQLAEDPKKKLMLDFYQMITMLQPDNQTSSYEFSCSTPTSYPSKKGLSNGAIAAIVIGSVVGVVLIGLLVWNMCKPGSDGSHYDQMKM